VKSECEITPGDRGGVGLRFVDRGDDGQPLAPAASRATRMVFACPGAKPFGEPAFERDRYGACTA